MRNGDTERRDVIRYLRSVLGNREIELHRTLSDDEVVAVIQTQLKQRADAAELFSQGQRDDLVLNEERQIQILSEYLPEQLPEEELALHVRAVANELNLSGLSGMSALMARVLGDIQGRADGRTVSRLAREELLRRESHDSGSVQ